MQSFTIQSLTELESFASIVATKLQPGSVIALQGNLGAGKTTFTKKIAKALEMHDTVTSPTFSVMNLYPLKTDQLLIHADLYRLNTEQDIRNLGIQDYIDERQHIVIIEWPEKAEALLPDDTIWIHFELSDTDTRIITIDNKKVENK